MKRLELIMGRNIPNAGKVSDNMINDFIKQEIIPHFEYGTFIDGEGLWKGEFENTKIFYIEVADNEAIATSVLLKHIADKYRNCLLYTSPSPRDLSTSRMPSSA